MFPFFMEVTMSTVAAISTPRAQGGISVIRISGEDALSAADRIFKPISRKALPSEMEGYSCAYGNIVSGSEVLDDGVLTVFRAPNPIRVRTLLKFPATAGFLLRSRFCGLFSAAELRLRARENLQSGHFSTEK